MDRRRNGGEKSVRHDDKSMLEIEGVMLNVVGGYAPGRSILQ